MGHMRHHAIIVTGHDTLRVNAARDEALKQFPNGSVSPTVGSPVNGYSTFLIGPDGSKEGWAHSNDGDESRIAFIRWLDAQRYEDGGSPLDWAEVMYGDDDRTARIETHSGQRLNRAHPATETSNG